MHCTVGNMQEISSVCIQEMYCSCSIRLILHQNMIVQKIWGFLAFRSKSSVSPQVASYNYISCVCVYLLISGATVIRGHCICGISSKQDIYELNKSYTNNYYKCIQW